MDSGSGFSVPKRKHSVSERTKRPSVARLLEKIGDEAEKSKRQFQMRSKPIWMMIMIASPRKRKNLKMAKKFGF